MTEASDAELERRTREAFTAAAQAALTIVRDAATAGGSGHGAAAWPRPASSDSFHAWRPHPATASIAQAVDVGWIVAPGDRDASRPDGRLSGLRVAVKDVIDVAGLPTRNGTPGATWRVPETSAAAWSLLADEGALCVGKAATHELAWGVTTAGVPHPLDPTRMPGGSSGGSAACVAAGVADAALGTDTGGSIRIPAALCGVVGLRPTTGSVPRDGVTPLAPTQDVVGPLAHDVSTCAAVAEVMLGRPLGRSTPSIGRVGVLTATGGLDDATAEAWSRTVAGLDASGAQTVAIEAAPLRLAGALSLLTMLRESAKSHADAALADRAGFGGEARALVTLGRTLEIEEHLLRRARAALRDDTVRVFADHGVAAVITPATACTAPTRSAQVVELGGRQVPVATALTRFTAWAATIGLPAISVPAPSESRLPVGIQVIAAPDDEATCLTVARLIEGFGGPDGSSAAHPDR